MICPPKAKLFKASREATVWVLLYLGVSRFCRKARQNVLLERVVLFAYIKVSIPDQ